ncbi:MULTISPECIES: Fic family protein [Microbacterium]|uniref:Fic family protein n=1 Tax=Microbacterium TaxID=33882 RepID=UPI00277E011C|nr:MULTISPECIES: Fic family protein [Microbacterium]MDQ1085044.1 Fic family protein [Microbacterium sp. SORGH_AS_0344]MDQ1169679.1 Fic family protein [Microbacterium proteolyticum]
MADKYTMPRLDFESPLVAALFEIERLRADIGTGDTPRDTFVELHQLFDLVMSVVSARIEGNHTTVYDALDQIDDSPKSGADQLREITNIAATARFIDSLPPDAPLTHTLIREIHRRVVDGLTREGDPTPGAYRQKEVAITNSAHVPPTWVTVHAEMSALLDFANESKPLHEQMLQIAVAHHRFVWIHPFRNGNGRVSRLFTYAMMRRTIFARRGFSALNPTAVFGNDRDAYITALERADDLSDAGTVAWAEFFVRGIRDDIARLLELQRHAFVIDELVGPALESLRRDGLTSRDEHATLRAALESGVVKAGDLEEVVPGTASHRSRFIRNLRERSLLQQAEEGPRFYRLSLARGPLAPRLIRRLDALGYLPRMLSDD